jgi:hypothetical protein
VFIVGTFVFILAFVSSELVRWELVVGARADYYFSFFFILSSFPHTGDGAALLV